MKFVVWIFVWTLLLGCESGLNQSTDYSKQIGEACNADAECISKACRHGYCVDLGEFPVQWGTSTVDIVADVAISGDNSIYVVGATNGSLSDNQSQGESDGFLTRFTADGNIVWTRQIGTPGVDKTIGVTGDGEGGVFVVGSVGGDYAEGQPSLGEDFYVAQFDDTGARLRARQWGSAKNEVARRIIQSGHGTFYVAGNTTGSLLGHPSQGFKDIFVAEIDSTLEILWSEQFGTSRVDFLHDMVLGPTGDLYLTGFTWGAFEGQFLSGFTDAFVLRCRDNCGTRDTFQWGTSAKTNYGQGIEIDSNGNIVVVGAINGVAETLDDTWIPIFKEAELFISIFNPDLTLLDQDTWQDVVAAGGSDVQATANGDIFVTGWTTGNHGDYQNSGKMDLFVVQYSNRAELGTIIVEGSSEYDSGWRMALDEKDLYLAGNTNGALYLDQGLGFWDVFLHKINLNFFNH